MCMSILTQSTEYREGGYRIGAALEGRGGRAKAFQEGFHNPILTVQFIGYNYRASLKRPGFNARGAKGSAQ